MAADRPVIALVAAAGQGRRLGAPLPKAFVELDGLTLVQRSVRALLASEVVDEIIVLVHPDMEATAQELFADAPVRIVHGRHERADSVLAGLESIAAADAIVLVHDAARALVPPEVVRRVVAEVAGGAPAAIPVVAVADTIKAVEAGAVNATPDRSGLRAAQTPQGFDLARLRAANEAYFADADPGFVATDDASLMEWFGERVSCVDGDVLAFKITTPLDLTLAQAVLADSRTEKQS
ncbi:2-C-methyl-D-erythritol 4-phosphate cytidylyltransferase [Corynebacterium uterequi]|uniref:2-C-methyl-D-erythritol 4-phosphate cytidylyltransferase n=1 Tax=Corynebacterium uterequi TaxID=1072256 RepID=A0A0G3HIT6_9CORY|nr:2-C-methyl-D-erythritol 4-phosphate cytidylyltransferase [Corynebacterium uterequi]AKK11853.1 2-C-methyl-D-erythritol 4-phosphate cytidylyltransferase [Corynebacterium uterequi]